MPQPTYVLVHGAWGGAWCWRDLTPELDVRGIAWRTMDLPSSREGARATTDLDDDATCVLESCGTDAPIVLVGHSYGGMVITQAAPLVASLQKLVYVAALVPLIGQSATATSRMVRVRTQLDDAIELDGDVLRLDPVLASSALYGHCAPATQSWATSKLSTQTVASFRAPRSAADVHVPTRYVACRDDHAIDPSLQSIMASRCDELVMIESDHSPFLSHPSDLADLLIA